MSLFSVGSIFQTKNLKHKCLPLRSRRQGNYSMLSSQLSNFPRTGWVVAAKLPVYVRIVVGTIFDLMTEEDWGDHFLLCFGVPTWNFRE